METCKRQHSVSAGNLLFSCIITQAGFYVTASMFHMVVFRHFTSHKDQNVVFVPKFEVMYGAIIILNSTNQDLKIIAQLMSLNSTNKHSIAAF